MSALDRKLALDLNATRLQAGINGKAFEESETHWLKIVRHSCSTENCLISAYRFRDAVVLDLSLRAASPAAYEDTRPFTPPPGRGGGAWSDRRLLCALALQPSGTTGIRRFRPVVSDGVVIAPLQVQGSNFIFVLKSLEGDLHGCAVTDAAALPAFLIGQRFMQRHHGQDSSGVGVRDTGGATLAYWSIDPILGRLIREPIHVIGM